MFALSVLVALAAVSIWSVMNIAPSQQKDDLGPADTHFSLTATPTNCTEPCAIHFEILTDDPTLIFFRWDFDNDSIWDSSWMTDFGYDKMYIDDYHGEACAQGFDGVDVYRYACVWVSVGNIQPSVSLSMSSVTANVTLRIAGEKWHDVSAYVIDGGNETLVASLMREPGKPQETTFSVPMNPSADRCIRIAYTPDDDPINGQPNGGTPAWLIFDTGGNSSVRMHHIFNVMHEDTHEWTVPLNSYFAGMSMEFTATATDPGADDLTFVWDFGDGSPVVTSTYINGGTYPFSVNDSQSHVYSSAGTYNLKVTVTDDDGGASGLIIVIVVI